MRVVVAVMLGVMASATLAADRSVELSQLVATERAFAARAQQVNVRQAFVEYFAANAILFTPFASPAFPGLREGPDWSVDIQWRPVAAAISGAGDMGFTTGPSEYRSSPAEPPLRHGHYTSVWQREPDGRYRVLIDIGIFHAAPRMRVDDGSLRPAPARPAQDAREHAAAVATLLEVDRQMGTAARGSAAARLTMMADDARLHIAGQIPAVGRAEALALLEALDHRYEWSPEGAAVAVSADFGFTYGRGRWQRNESPASGELAYLNVWQRDAGEWRLIVHVCNRIEPPP